MIKLHIFFEFFSELLINDINIFINISYNDIFILLLFDIKFEHKLFLNIFFCSNDIYKIISLELLFIQVYHLSY